MLPILCLTFPYFGSGWDLGVDSIVLILSTNVPPPILEAVMGTFNLAIGQALDYDIFHIWRRIRMQLWDSSEWRIRFRQSIGLNGREEHDPGFQRDKSSPGYVSQKFFVDGIAYKGGED